MKKGAMSMEQQQWLRCLPIGGHVKNRLKVAMILAGLENQEVAKLTGLRPQYVSAVAVGRVDNVSVDSARKFATALGLGIEDLFPGEAPV